METELLIGGLSASVAIRIIVDAAKSAFLPGSWAPFVAVFLGIAAGLATAATGTVSALQGVFLGVLSAGTASGLYTWENVVRERVTAKEAAKTPGEPAA